MLVFASAAALRLIHDWDMSYAELIPYATPGFVAYAVFSLPSGWLADRWSRDSMIIIFFIGIGLSSFITALAQTPLQIALGLTLIGIFAAIYHPVGIALVIEGHVRTGIPLAINGVFGNLGVGSAALVTGFFIDNMSWRAAFILPGLISVFLGFLYYHVSGKLPLNSESESSISAGLIHNEYNRSTMLRVLIIVFFSTAIGGLIFQSTTFSLPKVFDERLVNLAISATAIGWYAFLVFGVAALGQLVVGYLIDRYSVRNIFVGVAIIQTVMFAAMDGKSGWAALFISFMFMLAVFGQVPINDVLVGRVTRKDWRSRILAMRYVLTFSLTGVAIPAIAWIHGNMGFDALFGFLSVGAALILCSVVMLPRLHAITMPSN
jgi:MFS family permease